MPITTSYLWQSRTTGVSIQPDADADAASLANGGWAFYGNHAGHTDGLIFNASGASAGGSNVLTGTNAATAGLTTGNLVMASQDGDSILYTILSPVGGTVLATVDIGDTGSSNADVAALNGGGFVIVNQDNFSATDNDIDVRIYNAAGGLLNTFAVDSSGADDRDASVTKLDNGNIAVAWTRTIGTNSQVWTAVYTAGGAVVKAPTVFDGIGSVNRNVSLSATNAGFALVYEDNGWGGGTVDITLATLDFAGNFLNWIAVNNTLIVDDGSEDANPTVSRLSNGMLAVGWDNNFFSDSDTRLALTDATGSTVLASTTATLGQSIVDDVQNTTAAAFGLARLGVAGDNITDGNLDYETLSATRVLTGDAAVNTINATADMDHILYGLDGNDVLNGNAGSDSLYGGEGNDKLKGGAANDVLSGNNGVDQLDGGTGADEMNGGAGNDTYFVDNAGDLVFEFAGGGSDTVKSTISITSLASEVEKLILTGGADTNARGNVLDNSLTGNNGDNILSGLLGKDTIIGGQGDDTLIGDQAADRLTGGGGADKFQFNTLTVNADRDTVTDFVHLTDRLVFDKSVFTAFAGYASGSNINGSDFKAGTAATTANQNIIYNKPTGELWYDPDGVGGTAQTLIAILQGSPIVTVADIFVI